jgi:hypothetical protein
MNRKSLFVSPASCSWPSASYLFAVGQIITTRVV